MGGKSKHMRAAWSPSLRMIAPSNQIFLAKQTMLILCCQFLLSWNWRVEYKDPQGQQHWAPTARKHCCRRCSQTPLAIRFRPQLPRSDPATALHTAEKYQSLSSWKRTSCLGNTRRDGLSQILYLSACALRQLLSKHHALTTLRPARNLPCCSASVLLWPPWRCIAKYPSV